ncbi:MAG: lysophospholipid acyltransferase family protein [Caulobacteraceae bacterium]
MIILRSLAFAAAFYVWSGTLALGTLPLLYVAPPRFSVRMMRWWARGILALLRGLCGVRVVFRGLEHLPAGAILIAAKHQCMLDTMAPLLVLADPAFVMKRELMRIPVYGWYAGRLRMIVVDRAAGGRAVRSLVADARDRVAAGRQVVIFPEGHRTAPGAAADYKPGVAGLYRDLRLPCTPLATNSGVHWPAHGFLRRPGVIVYEFLPAIAAGLSRAGFMRLLEDRLEAASRSLLAL